MTTFTFIVPCKGRLEHVQRSLPPRLGLPDTENVVVDYACPDHVGDWVQAHAPAARVVRVEGEEHYNASAARNVGAALARGDWLVFVHADVIVDERFVEFLRAHVEPGVFFEAAPASAASGTLAVPRAAFRRVGGYDDVYVGWGEEDVDLRDRLVEDGLRPIELSERSFGTIAHADELRTRFHAQKDRSQSLAVHRVYRTAKFDLLRLDGRMPSVEARRDLWRKAETLVANGKASGEPEDLILSLSDQAFGVPRRKSGELHFDEAWRLKRSLVLELEWNERFELPKDED